MSVLWKNDAGRWGLVSIVVHWLSFVWIFGLFGLGFWMVDLSYYSEWYNRAPFIHKSLGVILLYVTLFRLVWRLVWGSPAALPTHTSFERMASRWVHIFLYIVLFGVLLSGYMMSTAGGRPISVFDLFEVPALIAGGSRQADLAGLAHYYLSYILVITALLHGLAALKHHVIDKDMTLRRMFGRY